MSPMRSDLETPERSSMGNGPSGGLRARADRLDSPIRSGKRTPNKFKQHHATRAPISPPPLRRSASSTSLGFNKSESPPLTWTVEELSERLKTMRQEMQRDHGLLAKHTIETTQAIDRRVHTGKDLFADFVSPSRDGRPGTTEAEAERTWRIKFKEHTGQAREAHYVPQGIKTRREPVPRYFNHHIEVEKNVVAPQTSMAFYPHKGDLDSPRKQKKWKGYIKQLDQSEVRSGLDAIKIDQKRAFVIHHERVIEAATYLETWLQDLGIPGLDKWSLIKIGFGKDIARYIVPEERTRVLASVSDLDGNAAATQSIESFIAAWKTVFRDEKATHGVTLPEISLGEVLGALLHNDILESETDWHAESSHEPRNEDGFEVLESRISTYSSLSCLICFRHCCEHGYYDDFNERERFTLEKGSVARRLAERQRRAAPEMSSSLVGGLPDHVSPCVRRCYQLHEESAPEALSHVWTLEDRKVLRSIYLSAASSKTSTDPICHVADLLERDCCDVNEEFKRMGIALPTTKTITYDEDDIPRLGWYNRYNKKLSKRHGADKFHKPNWDHIRRDIDNVCALKGCDHEGPCTPENKDCPCARKGQFCEKFCGCTVEECAYKFTGCACQSLGKTCQVDQKGEECICIQLNRECDPDLCGSCGALDRADPVNTHNEKLHATGCQNCALQRGVEKQLVVGKGQFHGYGLFAAENIRKDSFVIEYVGELVSGDEGDRRYIRRQNLFDGTKALSFNFTLLKECDVWVDGAKYGNLSRYINHEKDKCNLVPRIVLVNGGFRIEFRAKRNIKAWEELSFDYGEDFGLDIETNTRGKKLGKHSREVARKNAPRFSSRSGSSGEDSSDEEEMASGSDDVISMDERPTLKRKRSMRFESDDEEDEADYRPIDKKVRNTHSGRGTDRVGRATRGRGRGGGRGKRGGGRGNSRGTGRGRGRLSTGRRAGQGANGIRASSLRSQSPAPTETSEEIVPTHRRRGAGRRRISRASEIGDSEDDEASFRTQEDAERARVDRIYDLIDDDDDRDNDDDEENSTTPQKRDQPSRNRRQPAKFKDDELYGLKHGKRGGKMN